MIRTITVEREFASGGGAIAAALADRLGWALWDQRLTDEIARRVECDRSAVEAHEERLDPTYYRLLRAFMRGAFEGSVNARGFALVDADRVRSVTQSIQLELADAGQCVIVGRGSPYHLEQRRDALHVFIYAPFSSKVRRLMLAGKSEAEAVELVDTVDRDRAAFIRRYFDLEWPPLHRFHLMVNSTLGELAVVDTIVGVLAGCQKTS